jgi:MOSC domain-containing protein YiiM
MTGLLVSVNVGRIEAVDHHDGTVTTGIYKRAVRGRVATRDVNLVGDDQADRSVHGGPDRALYAYAAEDLEWWAEQLGTPLPAGMMGENLTTADVDVTNAVIGERWRIGTVVLEVTAPRVPCFKLGIKLGDGRFPIRFAAAGRPGAYLRIIEHGELGAGDVVTVADLPDHGVTAALVAHAFHDDHSLAAKLLTAPALGAGWPEWARRQLAA